jgi:uncharacterized damage-inducible protein DinB
MKMLFAEMADANRYINRTWLKGMEHLSLEEVDQPQAAFFDSIFGTWNHILVGDRIWMARIQGRPPYTTNLRLRPCGTLDSLRRERETTDADLAGLIDGESNLARDIAYQNTQGTPFQTPLYRVLAHLFAHQAHHRGQISQMCHARKIPVPDGGLIDFYRRPSA